jgi:aspartate 1-decarboxylase
MLRTFMHSKIHRATVTDSDLDYVGSLTVSPELLEAAGIGVHELVQVVDINNGARFETYTILGKPGAGEVIVNGAAARLVHRGDLIIIITYAQLSEAELAGHRPRVVLVDAGNRVRETITGEVPGLYEPPAAKDDLVSAPASWD